MRGWSLVAILMEILLTTTAIADGAPAAAPTATEDCGCLDLLLIVDDTSDQSAALIALRTDFMSLIVPAAASACGDVRYGVITFKDDVQADLAFTASATTCLSVLSGLTASGGNGVPEASNEAMRAAFDVGGSACAQPPGFAADSWRNGCCRVAILLTSAPPGGCNDLYDTPADSLDGLALARVAATRDIVLGAVCTYTTAPNTTAAALLARYAAVTQGAYGASYRGAGLSTIVANAISRCTAPLVINWADLQSPPTLNATAGEPSDPVYGRVRIDGVTGEPGPTIGLVAEVGYGPDGSDPSLEPAAWHWTAANYHVDVGGNDEFTARLTVPAAGAYDYCCRYANRGAAWVYGDLDGTTNGYAIGQAGSLVVAGPSAVEGSPAEGLRLQARGPNPFNPLTTLEFELPAAGPARLIVVDLAGRLVRTLVDESASVGRHEVVWDGRDEGGRVVGSGTYLARLEFGGGFRSVGLSLVR